MIGNIAQFSLVLALMCGLTCSEAERARRSSKKFFIMGCILFAIALVLTILDLL